MDKRTLRSKKGRPRTARPHDRQNQSIFGKVCSTVKGLLNPSWLISQWMGNAENESDTLEEETVREDNDVVCPSVSHGGNKRLRLRFDEPAPSIQNSGTQTWPEQPPQNLYDSISHVQSASTQSQLEKETIAVLNGDDHSENSEGSASTSGCSSLVSSHKESNKLVESPFVSLLELKNSRKRKLSASKSGLNDLNNSRTLWSSPTFQRSSSFQRRPPTISNTNQPSFNLSTFGGPSKANDSIDKKVSSPFYEGRTTFGGASASRKMPPRVTPYQVDKSRNKIRIRDTSSDDNLEGMSSAAKRILLTLEKMSSPVADARKVPNTDTSPIDMSLYLTPPKSHRNSQFTPSIAGKGPPIANINTIAKLATLKNYGASRLRSTLMSPLSTDSKMEKRSDVPANMFGVVFSDSMESQLPSSNSLPKENIPNLSCDTRHEKKIDLLPKPFVFSSPIELELPNNNLLPNEDAYLSPALDSKIKKNSNIQPKPFVFSSPIEHELPNNNVLHKENFTLPASSTPVSATDSPFSAWGQNSHTKTSVACDTPQVNKEPISALKLKRPAVTKSSPVVSSTGTAASTGFSFTSSSPASHFSFGNASPSLFTFGAPKTDSQSVSPAKPLTFGSASSTSTWECDACWVRNPEADLKCKACETPRIQKEKQAASTPTKKINSAESNAFSTWECSSCWVRNPMKEKKCMACETLHPNADKTSNFSFKDLEKAKPSTSVSLSNPQSTLPLLSQSTMPLLGVFGTKSLQSDAQATSVPTFSFGSASKTSTWECNTCLIRNPETEAKCKACEAPRPSKDSSSKDVDKSQATSTVSSSLSQTTTPVLSVSTAASTPSAGFVFGNKTEAQNTTLASFPFGSGLDKNKVMSSAASSVSQSNTVLPNASPATAVSTGAFVFGAPKTEAKSSTTTPFVFGSASNTSTWECNTCLIRNPETEAKCKACEAPRPSKDSNSKGGFTFKSESTSSGPLAKSQSSSGLNVNTTAPVSSGGFVFGAVKTENQSSTSTPFAFGSGADKSQATSTVSSSLLSTTAPVLSVSAATTTPAAGFVFGVPKTEAQNTTLAPFSFGSATNASTWECNTCLIRNPETEAKCKACEAPRPSKDLSSKGGFTFKSESTSSGPLATSQLPSGLNINTTAPVSSGGFVFGGVKTEKPSSTSTPFVFGSASNASTWECNTCLIRNPETEAKCKACEAPRPSKDSSSKGGFTFKTESTSSVPLATSQSSSGLNVNTTVSSGGFVFGAAKTEKSSTSTPFVFGTGVDKSQATSTVSSSLSQTTAPVLSVSTAASTPSAGFVFGIPKTEAQSTPAPFSFGSGLDKNQAMPSASSSVSQSITVLPNASTAAEVSTGAFVFGAPKTEAQSSTVAPFGFSSGTISTNTSAFSAFPASQSANPPFKFGSQPTGSSSAAVISTSNFSFAKSEPANQIPSSAPQNSIPVFGSANSNFGFSAKNVTSLQSPSSVSQAPSSAFGSLNTNFTFGGKNENSAVPQNPAPAFGSTSMQSVWNAPPAAPQNFAAAASSVFQFGAANTTTTNNNNTNADKKRAAPGFSPFMTQSTPETNNSFPTVGFNVSTPPSFNFGATSTPAGTTFQFAASSSPKPAPQSQNATRKIKKAFRRVNRN